MEKFQDAIKDLSKLLLNYQFDEAEAYIKSNVHGHEIIKLLHWLAEEETGILTYTFTSHLASKLGTAFWHQASAVLLMESLSHIPSGHIAGYYHLDQAIELAPADWKLKEYALNFYKEGLIELKDAHEISQEVLENDPDNALAKEVQQAMPAS
ncbi:MAG: hypothetical protein ACPGJS_12075 [Flammeovirgaceae bacterium]